MEVSTFILKSVLFIAMGVTSEEIVQGSLGNFTIATCREETVNLTWKSPNGDSYAQDHDIRLSFISLPSIDHPNPLEETILKKDSFNSDLEFPAFGSHYKGRLFMELSSTMTFTLTDVSTSDTGSYILYVNGSKGEFRGDLVLTVYSEDNIWARPVTKRAQTEIETPVGLKESKSYTFSRHEVSPATAVRMYARAQDGKTSEVKECKFHQGTTCTLTFTTADFEGLYGVIQMVVESILRPGTPDCVYEHKPFYNLVLVIPKPNSISKGTIAIIAVITLIVVAAIVVVPQIVIRYKKAQKRHIPLQEGPKFVKYCADIIESYTSIGELRGVYVATKPLSQIQHFFEVYRTCNGEPDEDYGGEKTLLSVALVTYLGQEKTPWLPLDLQNDISQGKNENYLKDDLTFDVEKIRSLLSDSTSKLKTSRYEVLQELMLHLQRIFQSFTGDVDRRKSKLPATTDIVEAFCRVLFKEVNNKTIKDMKYTGETEEIGMMSHSLNQHSQEQQEFLSLLIENADKVFTTPAVA